MKASSDMKILPVQVGLSGVLSTWTIVLF